MYYGANLLICQLLSNLQWNHLLDRIWRASKFGNAAWHSVFFVSVWDIVSCRMIYTAHLEDRNSRLITNLGNAGVMYLPVTGGIVCLTQVQTGITNSSFDQSPNINVNKVTGRAIFCHSYYSWFNAVIRSGKVPISKHVRSITVDRRKYKFLPHTPRTKCDKGEAFSWNFVIIFSFWKMVEFSKVSRSNHGYLLYGIHESRILDQEWFVQWHIFIIHNG